MKIQQIKANSYLTRNKEAFYNCLLYYKGLYIAGVDSYIKTLLKAL